MNVNIILWKKKYQFKVNNQNDVSFIDLTESKETMKIVKCNCRRTKQSFHNIPSVSVRLKLSSFERWKIKQVKLTNTY